MEGAGNLQNASVKEPLWPAVALWWAPCVTSATSHALLEGPSLSSLFHYRPGRQAWFARTRLSDHAASAQLSGVLGPELKPAARLLELSMPLAQCFERQGVARCHAGRGEMPGPSGMLDSEVPASPCNRKRGGRRSGRKTECFGMY